MGVNSPSMKTHRPTQGLGWCIETRVWIPAFVLWTRRQICDLPLFASRSFSAQHKPRHPTSSRTALSSVHQWHGADKMALEDQRNALCTLFADGRGPRWTGDAYMIDVRKCFSCNEPIKATKRVSVNGMNKTKAAAEAALWSAVWDGHGSCTASGATESSGDDAGSSGGSSSRAHADDRRRRRN